MMKNGIIFNTRNRDFQHNLTAKSMVVKFNNNPKTVIMVATQDNPDRLKDTLNTLGVLVKYELTDKENIYKFILVYHNEDEDFDLYAQEKREQLEADISKEDLNN